jgi:PKD repeat protein
VNRLLACCVVSLVLLGGCPWDSAGRVQPGVLARITISTTEGEPPLHVVVSAAQSSSTNGRIVKYIWDFAGESRAEEITAEHTFQTPGRHAITLTVVDETGVQARERVYVRVRGGPVTAVIDADPLSGPAPLAVRFDGTGSTAEDDTILDYFWDFGDGEDSRESAPMYVYQLPGTYIAVLRAVTGGGVEGTAEVTITVGPGAGGASLQFNGTQFATLPVTTGGPLSAFTFEAWCNPESEGGTLVSLGFPSAAVGVWPASGAVSLSAGSQSIEAPAPVSAGRWQYVAITYSGSPAAGDDDPNAVSDPNAAGDPNAANDPNAVEDPNAVVDPNDPNAPSDPNAPGGGGSTGNGTLTIYVNSAPIATIPLSGSISLSQLSLGSGFRGKIAGVRLWSLSRSEADIAADMNGSAGSSAEGLLGDWPLNDGSGQTLQNRARGGENGTLGATPQPEAVDPAWSSDSP